MKKIILSLFLIGFLTNIAYAAKLIIPFQCYPKEIQQEFATRGKKLDLGGNDRTRDSWGFIVNEGTQYTIYTYDPISPDDFKLISEIVFSNKAN